MSTPKEVNYFSSESIKKQNLFYSDTKIDSLDNYKKLFESTQAFNIKGEASVSYLFYPDVPNKIYDCIPTCKIIMVLRNPLDRGYSHYLMDYKLGLVDLPYEDIVLKKGNHKKLDLYYQQYVELGLYAKQLERYLHVFPKDQIKVYTQDELKNNISLVVDDLYSFLGADSKNITLSTTKHNQFSLPKNVVIHKLYSSVWLRKFLSNLLPYNLREQIKTVFFKKGKKPEISASLRTTLQEIYNPDIIKLNDMIEQDVLNWCGKYDK
jgi:hypothetical protein